MADTTTTTSGFTKVEVGASDGTWGGKVNANWDRLDDFLDGSLDITGIPNFSNGIQIGGNAFASVANPTVFTPEIADATTGGNTASIGNNDCFYTQTGRNVFCSIRLENINTTGLTGGNTLYLRGLPLTSFDGGGNSEKMRVRFVTFGSDPFPFLTKGTTYLSFLMNNSGGENTSLTVSSLTSGSACLYFDFNYASNA